MCGSVDDPLYTCRSFFINQLGQGRKKCKRSGLAVHPLKSLKRGHTQSFGQPLCTTGGCMPEGHMHAKVSWEG